MERGEHSWIIHSCVWCKWKWLVRERCIPKDRVDLLWFYRNSSSILPNVDWRGFDRRSRRILMNYWKSTYESKIILFWKRRHKTRWLIRRNEKEEDWFNQGFKGERKMNHHHHHLYIGQFLFLMCLVGEAGRLLKQNQSQILLFRPPVSLQTLS